MEWAAHHAAVEHAQLFHDLDGRQVAFGQRVIAFARHFREMNEERSMVFHGELVGRYQCVVWRCIDRVRRHGGCNQFVVGIMLEIAFGAGERLLPSAVIGGGEADNRLPQDAAHAHLFRGLRFGVFEIVHVRIGGNSAQHHLDACQTRSGADEIRRYILRFGRKNIVV